MYNIEISIDITSCKGYFLYWSFQKELLSKKKTKSYEKKPCVDISLILAVAVVVAVVNFLSSTLHYFRIIISYCALQDVTSEYW